MKQTISTFITEQDRATAIAALEAQAQAWFGTDFPNAVPGPIEASQSDAGLANRQTWTLEP